MSENSLQECSMLATTDSCISLELVKNKFTSVVEGITKVFEKEIINRQAKTQQLLTRLTASKNKKKKQIEDIQSGHQEVIKALHLRMKALEGDKQRVNQENVVLRMKLEQLRVEIANINDKCKSSSELKTPLQEINLRNEELQAKQCEQTIQIARLQAQITKTNSKINRLTVELSERNTELEHARQQNQRISSLLSSCNQSSIIHAETSLTQTTQFQEMIQKECIRVHKLIQTLPETSQPKKTGEMTVLVFSYDCLAFEKYTNVDRQFIKRMLKKHEKRMKLMLLSVARK